MEKAVCRLRGTDRAAIGPKRRDQQHLAGGDRSFPVFEVVALEAPEHRLDAEPGVPVRRDFEPPRLEAKDHDVRLEQADDFDGAQFLLVRRFRKVKEIYHLILA